MTVLHYCTKVLRFCAGHRIVDHEGGCARLHGHNYKAYITCVAPGLDRLGRVVDFGCIKTRVGEWIDQNLDHRFLMYGNDPLYTALRRCPEAAQSIVVVDFNPTAEKIAEMILRRAATLLEPWNVKPIMVRLWETETCYADAHDVEASRQFADQVIDTIVVEPVEDD